MRSLWVLTLIRGQKKKEEGGGYKSMKSPDASGKSVGDTRADNEILIPPIRFRFPGKTVDGDKITTDNGTASQ